MLMTKKMQQEVTAYIADTYNTKPYEWLTSNRFVDYHGADGYIFKSIQAARRYVLSDIHEFGILCQSACSDKDWIEMLVGIGMRRHNARRMVKDGRWDRVARRMLNYYGPSYFLSTYSGSVAVLSDESLLYY